MKDFVLYAVVMTLGRCLAILPLGFALMLGRAGGWFVYHILRLRRAVVAANVQHVFGDSRPPAEVRAITAGAFRHFGMFFVEVLRYAVANPKTAKLPLGREDIANVEYLESRKGKPLIICTPHHTNFDIGSYAFAMLGFRAHVVMKAIESPRINALMARTREAWGHKIIFRVPGVMDELIRLLKAGEWIGLLPDQRARNRGVVVDFLGKPVSIYRGIAALHLATGAPIAICTGERSDADPRKIKVIVIPVPPYEATGDVEFDTQAIMQRVFDLIGGVVRRSPEQYFWFHRLWGKILNDGHAPTHDEPETDVAVAAAGKSD